MQLPFTIEDFFGVFRDYNEAVWPVQVVLIAVALVTVLLAVRSSRWSGVVVSAMLAFLWAWMAVAYHMAFFASINSLAYGFAGVCLVGSLVFVWQGVLRRRLQFGWTRGWRAYSGLALVVTALLIYPVWSWYRGHPYPLLPTFGLPCPTTIFTIGLLAFLVPPYPRSPFIIPLLWCLIGVQAAFLLGVAQDITLLVAAAVGVILMSRAKAPLHS